MITIAIQQKKKCVLVNPNVGSAIEASGNQIYEWIEETAQGTIDIVIFKHQTKEEKFLSFLIEEQPSIIVINALRPRIITPILFYKTFYPETQIFVFARTFTEIMLTKKNDNEHEVHYLSRLEDFLKKAEWIFIINSCGIQERISGKFSHKIIDCCGTNSKKHYFVKIPWENRKKKFVILGSLNRPKISEKFINAIKTTNVTIDVYGSTHNQDLNLAESFYNCHNFIYHGLASQEKVADILNEYKYYLLPHDGEEPLCNSLHQAILCGCIPLVYDDYALDINQKYWLEYAEGMYLGYDKMSEYIQKVVELNEKDLSNGKELSNRFRERYLWKYEGKAEKAFKQLFKTAIEKL